MSNKKVAILVRDFNFYGGLEKYNFNLVQGLLVNDFKVTVLCQKDDSGLSHHNLKVEKIFETSKKMPYHQKLDWYFTVANKYFQDRVGEFDLIHSQQFPCKYSNIVSFHNHTMFEQAKYGYLGEKLLKSFKVKFKPKYIKQSFYDSVLANNAQALIFPSNKCLQDYQKVYNLDRAKLHVVYPASEYSEDLPYNKDQECINILFVGKGYRAKGLDILLKSLAILKQSRIKFHLNIIGLKSNLMYRTRLSVLNLTNEVCFYGQNYDLTPFYTNNDIIVQMSRVETFGMAVLEAMNYHVAPIVSSNCGISEIFENDLNGIIIDDCLDYHNLAQSLKKLILDQSYRHKIACNAYDLSKNFTWQKTIDESVAIYNAILEKRQIKI